ncbi:hypothetical protein FF098_013230 [Parvularcula flava]|uniref:Uncharacterized protein n=1 Tax=Aquisalinus luteolus TaxID=1566827 RepID=A0A8J3A543_9PROT|nr:hypothetical protein [Aquisalinus luteolus]NHK28878.1 hypothetical protein [Aquisalinus luteolus]GGH99789.1 hypothetical protein GCM10011355_26580 [Aquisalinus luteolus]
MKRLLLVSGLVAVTLTGACSEIVSTETRQPLVSYKVEVMPGEVDALTADLENFSRVHDLEFHKSRAPAMGAYTIRLVGDAMEVMVASSPDANVVDIFIYSNTDDEELAVFVEELEKALSDYV